MEFGREKCAILVIKSDKRHLTEEIELPKKEYLRRTGKLQDKIRTLREKETYKYLAILGKVIYW